MALRALWARYARFAGSCQLTTAVLLPYSALRDGLPAEALLSAGEQRTALYLAEKSPAGPRALTSGGLRGRSVLRSLRSGRAESMMHPGLGVAEQFGHGLREVAVYEVGQRHGFENGAEVGADGDPDVT